MLFVQRETVTLVPNVLAYESAIKSALAFDELYGEDGSNNEDSLMPSSGDDGP